MFLFVNCGCGRRFKTAEANAGRYALCPGCGPSSSCPRSRRPEEVLYIPDEPVQPVTSGKAIASLLVGILLPFACLSGVPAILLGRRAMSDIDQTHGPAPRPGPGVAGIVLGLIGCGHASAAHARDQLGPRGREAGSASTTSGRSASPCTTTIR